MTEPAELSICVPTLNRAGPLRSLLGQLAAFTTIDLEVVVVDNASGDDTPAVCAAFRDRLPGLRYLRRAATVPIQRNFSAALHAATGGAIYLMGDDDDPREPAFREGLDILAAEPELVAVYGGWDTPPGDRPGVTYDRRYDFSGARIDEVLELYRGSNLVRELPLARRAAYQDAVYADGSTGAVYWAAAAALLRLGSIALLPVNFIHKRTGTRVAQPYHNAEWQDMFAAEAESFAAIVPSAHRDRFFSMVIAKLVATHGVGYRAAMDRGDYLAARAMVLRHGPYLPGPQRQALAAEWEADALLPAAAQRLCDTLGDMTEITHIAVEASDTGTDFLEATRALVTDRAIAVEVESRSIAEMTKVAPSGTRILVFADGASRVRAEDAIRATAPRAWYIARDIDTLTAGCRIDFAP